MIVFFSFNNGEGSSWLPLGIILLSLVLQSGILSTSPLGLLYPSPYLYKGYFAGTSSGLRGQNTSQQQEGLNAWGQLVCIVAAVAISYFTCRLLIQFRREARVAGWQRTCARWWGMVWERQAVAGPRQHQQANGPIRRPASQQARFERTSKLVQQLPTEEFASKEDLDALSLHDLKVKLKQLGVVLLPGESLDRSEAIKLALECGGSSSTSCVICCEDYKSQNILRRLPCGHKFHLECIDRWLLSSTDYSRPSACPICNAEL